MQFNWNWISSSSNQQKNQLMIICHVNENIEKKNIYCILCQKKNDHIQTSSLFKQNIKKCHKKKRKIHIILQCSKFEFCFRKKKCWQTLHMSWNSKICSVWENYQKRMKAAIWLIKLRLLVNTRLTMQSYNSIFYCCRAARRRNSLWPELVLFGVVFWKSRVQLPYWMTNQIQLVFCMSQKQGMPNASRLWLFKLLPH